MFWSGTRESLSAPPPNCHDLNKAEEDELDVWAIHVIWL